MEKGTIKIWLAIAVAIVIALIGLVGGNQSEPAVAGMSNLDGLTLVPVDSTDGLKVGSNGSTNQEIKSTTCTLATTELPLEATSTDAFTCAITGVNTGDQVFVSLPSNSGSNLGGFVVDSATAGSGTITVGITNLTGAATSSFPLATTTVQVLYFDTL